MAVVYIREQGAVVCKRGSRILVEKEGETLLEILLRQTDSVAVFGNVQVTTQALSELLERGIPLALYTRHCRLKGTWFRRSRRTCCCAWPSTGRPWTTQPRSA